MIDDEFYTKLATVESHLSSIDLHIGKLSASLDKLKAEVAANNEIVNKHLEQLNNNMAFVQNSVMESGRKITAMDNRIDMMQQAVNSRFDMLQQSQNAIIAKLNENIREAALYRSSSDEAKEGYREIKRELSSKFTWMLTFTIGLVGLVATVLKYKVI